MAHPYQMARETRAGAPKGRPAKVDDTSTTRVFWDEDEKLKVALESFRILQNDTSLGNLEAVMRAQKKVLKPGRIRQVATFGKFSPWIVPMWDDISKRDTKQAEAKKGMAELFDAEPQPVPPEPVPPENQTVVNGTAHATTPMVPPLGAEPIRRQVHWRDDEKRTIAARVHYLLKTYHDMRQLEAVRKAVDSELPADRTRDIAAWSQVEQWIDPMLAQLKIDDQLAEIRQREERETRLREQAEQEAKAAAEETRIQAEVDERVEAAIAARIAQIQPSGLEAIIGLFAQRFADTFVNAVSESVSKAVAMHIGNISFGQPTKHEEKLAVPPRERLPRICVVGLLRQQEEDVQKAFLGTAEFVFVKSAKEGGNGHGGPGMLTKSSTCDMVIAMTDHMGQDVESSAKHLKIPYKRVPGSASACKRFITAWLTGEYPAWSAQ